MSIRYGSGRASGVVGELDCVAANSLLLKICLIGLDTVSMAGFTVSRHAFGTSEHAKDLLEPWHTEHEHL